MLSNKSTGTPSQFRGGLLLALTCVAVALTRCGSAQGVAASSRQFWAMGARDQSQALERVLEDTPSDEDARSTIHRLLRGPLGTPDVWHLARLMSDATAQRLFRILLRAAEEQGQLLELLRMTAEWKCNIFHLVQTEAQLRIFLGVLDRFEPLGLCAAGCPRCDDTRAAVRNGLPRDVPTDIGDLITSFLPQHAGGQLRSRLLNQQETSGMSTPLMLCSGNKSWGNTGSLGMVQLLVEAGADPNVGLFRIPRRTALDYARIEELNDIVAYLEPLTEAS